MAVYVDTLLAWGSAGNYQDKQAERVGAKNGHQWCHMWADTLDELHDMAKKIGLKRAWFQKKEHLPHYDLTPGRRAVAVKKGAVEVGHDQLRDFMAKRKERGTRLCYSCETEFVSDGRCPECFPM
jgi:hypothetical protein